MAHSKTNGFFFEKDSDTIGLHLKNIFLEQELDENSTSELFSVVQQEGNRKVKRNIKFYNLDAILPEINYTNSLLKTKFWIYPISEISLKSLSNNN